MDGYNDGFDACSDNNIDGNDEDENRNSPNLQSQSQAENQSQSQSPNNKQTTTIHKLSSRFNV